MQKDYLRLQEEHTKVLDLSRKRIQKWEQFKGDYEALQARLCTLPDRLTHDIMVPFGRFAFMPGQLHRTNEVMVLLGDNWFAKRSAKQAVEIAERRKQYVMKLLEEERKQLEDWEARRAFTEDIRTAQQEHKEVVEIKEDYHTDSDQHMGERRVWQARKPKDAAVPPPRPAHPKASTELSPSRRAPCDGHTSTAVSAKKGLPSSSPARGAEGGENRMDEQLWKRLEELEREEEGVKEEERSEVEGRGARRSRIHERDDDGVDVNGGPLHIAVKHVVTSLDRAISVAGGDGAAEDTGKERPLFTTPADISSRSCLTEGGSGGGPPAESGGRVKGVRWAPQLEDEEGVLAKTKERRGRRPGDGSAGRGEKDPGKGRMAPTMPTSTPLAFSGQVIERTPYSMERAPPVDSEKQKKPSKFKASRKALGENLD